MNKRMLRIIAGILVEKAQLKELITYGELSQILDNSIHPRNLDRPLGIISERAQENDYPKISAIVINQDIQMPGDGFFKYFAGHIEENNWQEFWEDELDSIFSWDEWDSFLELFD